MRQAKLSKPLGAAVLSEHSAERRREGVCAEHFPSGTEFLEWSGESMYKIRIVDPGLSIAFDSKRSNMKGKRDEIQVFAYSPSGKSLSRKQLDINTGKPVQYTFKYIDTEGNTYEKPEVTFKNDKGEELEPQEMTAVFDIKTYRPINEFTDRFVVDTYYELSPDTGASSKGRKSTSDFEREQTRVSNLVGMKKLWDKLYNEAIVAGGHFNGSSGTFNPGMAFIRAIKIGDKWGLELGIFKEEKVFECLNDMELPKAKEVKGGKKAVKSDLL